MKTARLLLLTSILSLAVFLCSCSTQSVGMQNGYYRAEADLFNSYGWKEYITIYVSDGKILTVEYDAYTPSGFVRSWDTNYMRLMKTIYGTYPSEFARAYTIALLNWQDPSEIEATSGASVSRNSFQLLAEAAMSQAKAGNRQVALVSIPESDEPAEG